MQEPTADGAKWGFGDGPSRNKCFAKFESYGHPDAWNFKDWNGKWISCLFHGKFKNACYRE